MKTRLILVRHGQTDWNLQNRFQGSSDIPLNSTGSSQARRMAQAVAPLAPQLLVCSDLSRAHATARILGAATGLVPLTDERLREIHCGDWEGQFFLDVVNANPWIPDFEREGRDYRRSPSGETAGEAGARGASALEEIAVQHEGLTIAAVAHGLLLREAMLNMLGWRAGSRVLDDLRNCSWSVLEGNPGAWRLASYNVVADAADALAPVYGAEEAAG